MTIKTSNLAVLFLTMGMGVAAANIITPGSTVTITDIDTTTLSATNLAGDTGVINFTGMNSLNQIRFTGQLREQVYRNVETGGLDFYYQLYDNSSALLPSDTLSRFSNATFDGFKAAVFLRNDLNLVGVGTVMGNVATRSLSGVIGDTNFNGGTGLGAGQVTYDFVVKTNATQFTVGSTNVLDGAVATFNTLEPTSTPEPGTVGLGLLGISYILQKFRARKKA